MDYRTCPLSNLPSPSGSASANLMFNWKWFQVQSINCPGVGTIYLAPYSQSDMLTGPVYCSVLSKGLSRSGCLTLEWFCLLSHSFISVIWWPSGFLWCPVLKHSVHNPPGGKVLWGCSSMSPRSTKRWILGCFGKLNIYEIYLGKVVSYGFLLLVIDAQRLRTIQYLNEISLTVFFLLTWNTY